MLDAESLAPLCPRSPRIRQECLCSASDMLRIGSQRDNSSQRCFLSDDPDGALLPRGSASLPFPLPSSSPPLHRWVTALKLPKKAWMSWVSGPTHHLLWLGSSPASEFPGLMNHSWIQIIGLCCCLPGWAAEQQIQRFSPFPRLLGKNRMGRTPRHTHTQRLSEEAASHKEMQHIQPHQYPLRSRRG